MIAITINGKLSEDAIVQNNILILKIISKSKTKFEKQIKNIIECVIKDCKEEDIKLLKKDVDVIISGEVLNEILETYNLNIVWSKLSLVV